MMHRCISQHNPSYMQDLLMKDGSIIIKANNNAILRRNVDLFQFAFGFSSFDALLYIHNTMQSINQSINQQDHQALLKAKYCPRVAAASYTQKNLCDLDL